MSTNGGFDPLPTTGGPVAETGGSAVLTRALAEVQMLNLLVPQVGTLAAGTILLVKMLIPLFKRQGIDIGPFEQEIAKLDAGLGTFQSSIDEFNRAHPKPQEPPAEPPTL